MNTRQKYELNFARDETKYRIPNHVRNENEIRVFSFKEIFAGTFQNNRKISQKKMNFSSSREKTQQCYSKA